MPWPEVIANAPVAAVVVITVILFLRFLDRENKRKDTHDLVLIQRLEKIGEACHEHTLELNERACVALDKSSGAIDENTKTLGINVEVLRGIERRINGK